MSADAKRTRTDYAMADINRELLKQTDDFGLIGEIVDLLRGCSENVLLTFYMLLRGNTQKEIANTLKVKQQMISKYKNKNLQPVLDFLWKRKQGMKITREEYKRDKKTKKDAVVFCKKTPLEIVRMGKNRKTLLSVGEYERDLVSVQGMTETQFREVFSKCEKDLTWQAKSFYVYGYGNRKKFNELEIFDWEDLFGLGAVKIFSMEYGKTKSYYITAVKNYFKDLLREVDRRWKKLGENTDEKDPHNAVYGDIDDDREGQKSTENRWNNETGFRWERK